MDIAVRALSGVVDALPGKLGAVLERTPAPAALLSGVRFVQSEFSWMRDAVYSWMRDAVSDCESRDEPDVQTCRAWVIRVCELAYDIDDWVDLFALQVHAGGGGSKPSTRFLRRLLGDAHNLTTLPTLLVVTREFEDLKWRVSHLREQRLLALQVFPAERFLDFRSVPQPLYYSPLSALLVEDLIGLDGPVEGLVGLDGPIEEVAKMVMDAGDKAELKIVSIVGMAGSGKTKLANAVYRRLGEQNCFQCRAFVYIGPKPDLRNTLLHTLSMLTNRHEEDEDIDHLIVRLREILETKRYLIVVDDLWSREHWDIIKCCFPEDSLGSRIITTTRNVALVMGSDCIYNIRLLSEIDSRKLILNILRHDCSQYLEDVSSQITRCGGLPLALVTLAYMLIDGQFSKGSGLPRWFSKGPAGDMMKGIFDPSYNDLPPHLKTCLLYLSIFPEKYEVDVDRLMRRWIADMCIVGARGIDVEEIARSYLNELISRNMVQGQPLHLIHDVAPSYCRLHPVMYDFIVCKSMEENIFTLADDQNPVLNNRTVRWLSIQSSMQDQYLTQNGSVSLSRVRSVTVFGQASAAPRLTDLSLVRVLDLEGCDGPVCLDGLNNMLLLRYLSLRGTDVIELPAAIWELRFLETLDVRSTKVKELPRSIAGLRNTLRTLLFSHEGTLNNSIETATRIAEDIQYCGRLEYLATIDLREHDASFVKGLGALDSLRMISIKWSFQQCTDATYREALLSSIEKWRNLKSLTIHCGLVGCSMNFMSSLSHPPSQLKKFKVTAGSFICVPKWTQRLNSLYFVQINMCKLGIDDLKILRGLPSLQQLILGLDFVPREAVVIESEGFSELLRFAVDCPVPWLTFRAGAMPKLTNLQLEFCSGSATENSVPCGIGNLQRLTEVVLLYNQKWCANSSSIKMTVDAVRKQVVKHRNPINLVINDTKVDVREVDDETERN